VRPALSQSSPWEGDEPSLRIKPSTANLISLVAGCGTRLSNKINAAGSTNPLIWTALMD
jgi:hypothetical protein